MQNFKRATYTIMALALLLASCTTQKRLNGNVQTKHIELSDIANLPSVAPDTLDMQYLSSNIKLRLGIDKEKTTLKGKLRIKQGCGIQISISAYGVMEALCLEFLPDKIRLINKLSKTYTETPYSEADIIGLSGISYGVLEAIFLNRIFLPDGSLADGNLDGFTLNSSGKDYILTTAAGGGMKYSFHINRYNGNLVSSNGTNHLSKNVKCRYSDFKEVNGPQFPYRMEIIFRGEMKLTLKFEHSKLSDKEFKFSPRRANKSYTKLEISDFMNSIN